MEFRFKYTIWERVYFVSRGVILQLSGAKIFFAFIGVAWLLMAVLPDFVLFVSGNSDAGFYGAWFLLLGIVLLLLVTVLMMILANLAVLWQRLKEERQIHIKEGMIFSEMTESKTTAEHLCKTIKSVKVSGPLIWLEFPLSRKNGQYLLIPTREFGSRLERNRFFEYLQRQQNMEPALEPGTVRQIRQAEWHIQFNLESDVWISVNAQTMAVRKRGLLGYSFIMHGLSIILMLIATAGIIVFRVGREEPVDVAVLAFWGVFMVVIYQYIMHQPVREDSLRRQQKWGLLRDDVVGPWEISFNQEGIEYVYPIASGRTMWNQMKWIVESDDLLFLFTPKREAIFYFDKALLGGNNKRLEFIEYCQAQGLEYKRIRPAVEKKSPPLIIRFLKELAVIIGIVVMIVVGLFATVFIRAAIKRMPQETQKQSIEAETSFVFRPEEYEHYISLDEQVTVLSSLGFRISEESVGRMKEWLEDWPESRAWVEGNPYTSLLTETGFPERNTETWEVESYSEQAYWFDFEGSDVSSDYVEMLNGINALSGGAFSITEVATDESQVDWENGTGMMTVNFKINETAYVYSAKMHYDWLDEGILDYIGQSLAQEASSGRLYGIGDGGQGAILFYRDSTWAREFERKTGIELEDESS